MTYLSYNWPIKLRSRRSVLLSISWQWLILWLVIWCLQKPIRKSPRKSWRSFMRLDRFSSNLALLSRSSKILSSLRYLTSQLRTKWRPMSFSKKRNSDLAWPEKLLINTVTSWHSANLWKRKALAISITPSSSTALYLQLMLQKRLKTLRIPKVVKVLHLPANDRLWKR